MSTYRVTLIETEEGWAVICDALPGCCSQGATRDDALANIKDAIRDWLVVAEEDALRPYQQEGARFSRELVAI